MVLALNLGLDFHSTSVWSFLSASSGIWQLPETRKNNPVLLISLYNYHVASIHILIGLDLNNVSTQATHVPSFIETVVEVTLQCPAWIFLYVQVPEHHWIGVAWLTSGVRLIIFFCANQTTIKIWKFKLWNFNFRKLKFQYSNIETSIFKYWNFRIPKLKHKNLSIWIKSTVKRGERVSM